MSECSITCDIGSDSTSVYVYFVGPLVEKEQKPGTLEFDTSFLTLRWYIEKQLCRIGGRDDDMHHWMDGDRGSDIISYSISTPVRELPPAGLLHEVETNVRIMYDRLVTESFRKGGYRSMQDEDFAAMPMETMSFLMFDEYFRRMLLYVDRDMSLFDMMLQRPSVHTALARKGDPKKFPPSGRMFLTQRSRKTGDTGIAESLFKRTPHNIQTIEMPDFRDILISLLDMIESPENIEPTATTVHRQYAHDLLLSLAQISAHAPIPYCSTDMLLMYHVYRFLCEKDDNIYAAATSPQVIRLRAIICNSVTRDRIMVSCLCARTMQFTYTACSPNQVATGQAQCL